MEFGPRVVVVEDFTHQETHRARHLVGVLNQGLLILEQNLRSLVVHEPLNQGGDDFCREVVFTDHASVVREEWVLVPAAFAKGSLDVFQMLWTIGNIAVGHVVKHPAKGIENSGVLAHFFAKEATSPMEAFAAGGQNVFRVVGDLFRVQSRHLKENSLLRL